MFNTKELTDDQGSKVEQWIEISEYEQNGFKIINFRCFFITYTKIKHRRRSNRQVLIRGEKEQEKEQESRLPLVSGVKTFLPFGSDSGLCKQEKERT